MERGTFDRFRALVYQQSGITLGENKLALVNARVAKRLRALGLSDVKSYLDYVQRDERADEVVNLLDVISTNVTSFYREPDHFQFIAERFEEWLARGQQRFRFWCAASSSGEEPYTLAMTLLETAGRRPVDVKILGTDISTRMLERCRAAEYPEERMQSVPAALRTRYFTRVRDNGASRLVAGAPLRRVTVFRRLNLAEPPFPMKGPLDAVFCRNVMIYFDDTVRRGLLSDIHRLLRDDGFLFVGHAESLTGMVSAFRTVQPSVYRK